MWRSAPAGLDVLFVGVRCSLEAAEERKRTRPGQRAPAHGPRARHPVRLRRRPDRHPSGAAARSRTGTSGARRGRGHLTR
ncbi:chloramphenicol phosphotransferase CPT family protein [Nonomuraea sp. NEAU-A123]|uniref:chloramphenicol phosphotransferase CPT family protein n=1 Tax=Nonomuraea sp. NEAU-A123 TaxID=2839649 RepID=UPI001BE41AB6|nr:hypothetical protein [Nonomuraea sp. NEAU-A123]